MLHHSVAKPGWRGTESRDGEGGEWADPGGGGQRTREAGGVLRRVGKDRDKGATVEMRPASQGGLSEC